jgi:Uma2 family endonuclease
MDTTPVLVSVEEYLHTVYRPDCDFVDGEVLDRNMGEKPHARLQKFFLRFLESFEEDLNVEAFPEHRLQISAIRYRIPDVMLVSLPSPDTLIVRTPPILCIEILSSEDRMAKIRERVREYATIGVPTSWVIDPWRRTAFTAGAEGTLHETTGSLTVPSTPISIPVDDVFAELDRLEKRAAMNTSATI